MTGAMCKTILDICCANYPNYGEDLKSKGILWMKEFQKYQDDLMYTAILSCFDICKKFPTIADIKEAIQLLQYDEQTKPKQLEHRSNWSEPLADKAFKMVASGQAKKFMQEVDISDLLSYARQYFADISEETVRKNLPEFYQGQESQDACFACRLNTTNECVTKGFVVKHWMEHDGQIVNQMLKCQKNVERSTR